MVDSELAITLLHGGCVSSHHRKAKKADVLEHPKAFGHVGLLFNGPPEKTGLPFIESSDDFESRVDLGTAMILPRSRGSLLHYTLRAPGATADFRPYFP